MANICDDKRALRWMKYGRELPSKLADRISRKLRKYLCTGLLAGAFIIPLLSRF